MAEGGDDQDRTEQATPHKLEKAREEGKVAHSREVASAFVVVVAATGLALALPPLAARATGTLAAILAHAGSMRPVSNDMRAAGLIQPQQDDLGVLGQCGKAVPHQSPVVVRGRHQPVEPQQPRPPVELRRQRLRVVAQRIGAIERAAREPDRCQTRRDAHRLNRDRSAASARTVSCRTGQRSAGK